MSPPPIAPPATIGILGGGQLGRMLALAARAMGYRIAVMDPDPDCPAASLADRQIVAGYDDVGGALRLAAISDVVTYELEHVAAEVVDAIAAEVPVRPGRVPLLVTQDRLAERQFAEVAGAEVAPWRAVRTTADLRARRPTWACRSGSRPPPAATTGGASSGWRPRRTSTARSSGSAGRPETALLAETETGVRDGGLDHRRARRSTAGPRPSAGPQRPRRRHPRRIVAPAPVAAEIAERAAQLGERLAVAMGLVGTLTAELFLMPDGRLVVNELAPRVHNSGHWTIEGAATSQFEQHIRAICGLELGSTAALAPTAMVNLLGTGPRRPPRLDAAGPRRGAGRSGRASPPVRQAPGIRTSQDGPRDGAGIDRR